jgi:hypothetical protein
MNLPDETPISIEADYRSLCWFSDHETKWFQMLLDCRMELVQDPMGQMDSGELGVIYQQERG